MALRFMGVVAPLWWIGACHVIKDGALLSCGYQHRDNWPLAGSIRRLSAGHQRGLGQCKLSTAGRGDQRSNSSRCRCIISCMGCPVCLPARMSTWPEGKRTAPHTAQEQQLPSAIFLRCSGRHEILHQRTCGRKCRNRGRIKLLQPHRLPSQRVQPLYHVLPRKLL